ncbi:helix-turn-helix domain-containing protein [Patescibacteria group bacterium]|nr:helix-turn-helix domain-containing protein [Patescibacteria group bacterium]
MIFKLFSIMTGFIHKKLSPSKPLPEILREERLKNNLSLDEVSFKTQILVKYLEIIEDGLYDKLPGTIYTKQFIKKLAKLYSLNEKILLLIYQREKESQLTFPIMRPVKIPSKHLTAWFPSKVLRNFLILILLLVCLGYLGWEIRNISTPPLLKIKSPQTHTITDQSNIEIIGQTEPEVSLMINNQEILPEPNGLFSKTVDLTMGVNTFTISAKKEHSKENTFTLSVLRQ